MPTIPKSDREAVAKIINGLLDAGCTPTVARDGANEDMAFKGHTRTAFLDHLLSCDEGVMFVDLPNGESTHVYFVYGNEPIEVAADHGVSLTPYIDPITQPWWE